MKQELIANLGPLAPLAGSWEGDKGDDMAPDENPRDMENNKYRERLVLEPFLPVNNHAQTLYGLRYSTMAWRLGAEDPFHEELGYWLWDPAEKQVLRCFIVPRGVTVIAGGTVEPGAQEFQLAARVGSETYGICSNQFLEREFKTIRYDLKVTIHNENSFSYDEDTQLQIKGQGEPFHHTDKNTLNRI
jgi:hypothetical protein